MRAIDDSLLSDVSWREDELAALKAIYGTSRESEPKGRTLRRAYLALLYAHYEGFAKFAWEEYLIRAAADPKPLIGKLPCLVANFTKSQISGLRSCPEQAFVETAVGYLDGLSRPGPHRYAAVETSNLWPNIFEETCSELGLSSSYIEPHRLNLKSLVSRRNDIAHGKDVGVSDKDLYKLETSAWAMMLALAEEVATAVHQKKYLHQGSLLAQ